jgi:hypothetical protein
MLIATKSKKEITTLKAQLSSEFERKDLGAAKKKTRYENTRDKKKSSVLFLSQQNYIKKSLNVLICMMQSLLVHILLLTSNCQHCSDLVLMEILSTCHEFFILVLLVL